MHRQFINSCLSCSIGFFATHSSQFFNFLATSCMIVLERVYSSIPILHTSWFHLFGPDLPIDLLAVAEIVEIRIPDWSHEERNQNFSFPNISLQLLPQLHTIFAEPFPHLGRQFQLSSQRIWWRCSLSLNDCTTFWSRSLFPLDSVLRRVVTDVSLSRSAPVSPMFDCQPTHHPPTVSRGNLLRLYACCCWTLLSVEVHQVLWMWRLWWHCSRAGKSRCCWGGWSMCACRWHRHRTWAHTLEVMRWDEMLSAGPPGGRSLMEQWPSDTLYRLPIRHQHSPAMEARAQLTTHKSQQEGPYAHDSDVFLSWIDRFAADAARITD